MSRFYGSLTGQAKITVTRQGNTDSGVMAHVRGWDIGVKVWCRECPRCGGDYFVITQTGGSNNSESVNGIKILCSGGCLE